MDGTVEYKGEHYAYELDDDGEIWITTPSTNERERGKINIKQERSVNESEDIRSIVLDILQRRDL